LFNLRFLSLNDFLYDVYQFTLFLIFIYIIILFLLFIYIIIKYKRKIKQKKILIQISPRKYNCSLIIINLKKVKEKLLKMSEEEQKEVPPEA
jgi:predicted Holliday junction resolvase-like endonuclease